MVYEKTLEGRLEKLKRKMDASIDKVICAYDSCDAAWLVDEIEELKKVRDGIVAAEDRLNGVKRFLSGVDVNALPLNNAETSFLEAVSGKGITDPDAVKDHIKEATGCSNEDANDAFAFLVTWGLVKVVPDQETGKNVYELREYGKKVYNSLFKANKKTEAHRDTGEKDRHNIDKESDLLKEVRNLIDKVKDLEKQVGAVNRETIQADINKDSSSSAGVSWECGPIITASAGKITDTATVDNNGDYKYDGTNLIKH